MPIAPDALALLVCPETHMALRPAAAALIDELNARAERGELKNHAGLAVSGRLSEALVRLDGACLYRLDDGVTNLLLEERIDLDPPRPPAPEPKA